MKITKLSFIFFILLMFCAVGAHAEKPLVQEGKKTVFQRVVSHPNAKIYADAGASSVVREPRTFSSLYVYENKGDMVKVGVSDKKSEGWMKKTEVTNWPQAITMVFTDQMEREPVLFFKDEKSLKDLCNSDNIGETVKKYVGIFENPDSQKPANMPVIASEPTSREGQVSQKNFYLLPVLRIDDEFREGGTLLLEVVSIDPGISGYAASEGGDQSESQANDDNSMKTGLVFLVDTTKSMGPYIEQTKNVIETIFDKLQDSPAKDNVSIAVVAFRSNPKLAKGTEYNTKIITDFVTVNDRDALLDALDGLEECQASTHAFDEDSLSGVKEAVDNLSWDKINARAMLMVTDAGPLAAGDKAGATGMSPEAMADYLKTNKIYLTVAHILTPQGKKDKAYAEKSYKELSLLSNKRSSYIPINAPTKEAGAESFKKAAESLSNVYATLSERTMKGNAPVKPKTKELPKNASPEEMAKQTAEAIGYAMRLQFAGDKNKARAPQVVKAWISDADLPSLEENANAAPVPVVEPAVLMTKSQLDALREQLAMIVRVAEEAFLQDSKDFNFFQQVLSAAAQMSRDPTSFKNDPNANLSQSGVLSDVLEGLPYKSQVLRLSQDDWTNMSTGAQQEFIRRLNGLIRRYEEYDRDNEHWEGFGSKDRNEWVYRVPLSMLP